ncbi:MAG: hypothetical protein FJ116_02215, partial [Deltaproteobacteria bacterium]|nr:hypothetical protein [Deltaproteobacteria bacterium]
MNLIELVIGIVISGIV